MEYSITVKIITGFIGLLIVIRILGKKELSQLTPIDLVYLLVLGGILEESTYYDQVPFWEILYTADRLNLDPAPKPFSYLLVDEGEIEQRNLKEINKSEGWIRSELDEIGYPDIKNIFYAEWSKEKGFIVREREKV